MSSLTLKAKLKKGNWVIVDWNDAATHGTGWTPIELAVEKSDTGPCRTAGLIIKSKKKYVVIAQTVGYFNDDKELQDVNCYMAIPLDWVQKVKVIE